MIRGILHRLAILLIATCFLIKVESASGETLSLSPWTTTEGFSEARTSLAAVIFGNRVYLLGGLSATPSDFTIFGDVQTAVIGNDGLILKDSWSATTPLPMGRSGLGAVIANGRLYVVGGYAKSGTLSDTIYAAIKSDGTLDQWMVSPYHLNTPRSNHRLELFTTPSGKEYLAVIAGVGEIGPDTVHFDDTEVASLNDDGSIGQWKKCPFHLKGGRSAPATLIVRGRLYVMGGWGDLLNDVFKDVQYASIRDDGCLDPWRTSPFSLNMPLYGHTSALAIVSGNPIALLFGGNAGQGNYFSNVQMAPISSDGEIGAWSFDDHQFSIARWGQASVQYNDFVYLFGGAQIAQPGFLSDAQVARLLRH